jgi:hypothetical protein
LIDQHRVCHPGRPGGSSGQRRPCFFRGCPINKDIDVMPLFRPNESDRRRSAWVRVACIIALALSFVLPAHAQKVLPPDLDDGEGGWSLTPVSGTDETGRDVHSEIMQIEGARGVAFAPIPEIVRDQLIEELALAEPGETVVFALNAPIIEEIERSLALGQPTQALIDYANQDNESVPYGNGISARGPFGSCSDGSFTKSKRLQYTPNFSSTQNLGNGFSGTLSAQGIGNLDANGEVKMRVKRTKIFWVCVPYGVRFEHVRAVGNLTLESTVNLNGSISYANPNPIEYELAKPSLGGVFFMVGPLPVYIGFNLPITVGIEIQASVTGQLQYRGGQRITGSFDYLCTASNCTGYNTLQSTVQNVVNPIGASISGRIKPSLYADVGVRGFLYAEAVAYAQVGVRGYLHGDLWGYYGNACGDADQNGHYETVSALTFGLDWQIAITARADTFFTSPWKKTLWKSDQWYIGFWDLIGSSALTPMIEGPASIGVGVAASYKIRMRPCWPYGDNVDYTMSWGDSTNNNYTGAPNPPSWQPVLASHVWNATGPTTLQLTAWRDAHGRQFGSGRSTSRLVQIVNAAPVNRALEALPVASSTYCSGAGTVHCYSPDRVNDGSRSTTLGGFTSWSNDVGVSMPQWLELQWGQLLTISRVDLYTTDGYALKDYDIQYWNGTGWVTAASIRNNTALSRSDNIAPVQTFRLRILAFSGPDHQINHARINELEVY